MKEVKEVKVENKIVFNFRGKKSDITELSKYLEKLELEKLKNR